MAMKHSVKVLIHVISEQDDRKPKDCEIGEDAYASDIIKDFGEDIGEPLCVCAMVNKQWQSRMKKETTLKMYVEALKLDFASLQLVILAKSLHEELTEDVSEASDEEDDMTDFALKDKKEKEKFGVKLDNIYKYNLTTEEKTALSLKNEQQKTELKMELGKKIAEYDFLFKGKVKSTATASSSGSLTFQVVLNGKTKTVSGYNYESRVSSIRNKAMEMFGYESKDYTRVDVYYNNTKVSTQSSLKGKAFAGMEVKSGDTFELRV
eukprot:s5638_g3.t1